MSLGRKVLLVSVAASRAIAQAIRTEGYHLTVTSTFQVAKTFLAGAPDLLITELKLGDYNGLHLALRAAAHGIPAIVVAEEEFQHEVEQLGAVWLSPEAARSDDLHIAMTRLLPETASSGLREGHAEAAFPAGDLPVSWSGLPGLVH